MCVGYNGIIPYTYLFDCIEVQNFYLPTRVMQSGMRQILKVC